MLVKKYVKFTFGVNAGHTLACREAESKGVEVGHVKHLTLMLFVLFK